MPKDTFWFSHDYHSRSDKELIKVRMKYGMTGVGIFWCIVEMLYEENGYLNLSECERIAFELNADCGCISDIINNFKLFKHDKERFWSEAILSRLSLRKEKSEEASKAALTRWDNHTFGMRTHSVGNAINNNIIKNNKEYNNNKYIIEDISEKQKKVKFELKGMGSLEIKFFTNCERWQIRELFHFITDSQKQFETIAISKPFVKESANFQMALQYFINSVQEKGDYKEKNQLNNHFVNWLNKQNGSLESLISKSPEAKKAQPKIKLK